MSRQRPRSARRSWLASSALLAGVLILSVGVAHPAGAITCRQWARLGPDQRLATVDRMIENAVGGSGGRQYQIDRGGIGRCLYWEAENIGYDFDRACSDASTAGMQALDKIFKSYIWSCGNS